MHKYKHLHISRMTLDDNDTFDYIPSYPTYTYTCTCHVWIKINDFVGTDILLHERFFEKLDINFMYTLQYIINISN